MILLRVSLKNKIWNKKLINIDLFLTINNNNEPKFRIYELPIAKLKLIKEYDPPAGVAIYHLSTFADIGIT
jgi:hypothetical protein